MHMILHVHCTFLSLNIPRFALICVGDLNTQPAETVMCIPSDESQQALNACCAIAGLYGPTTNSVHVCILCSVMHFGRDIVS